LPEGFCLWAMEITVRSSLCDARTPIM
jgi:hypothetical protein